MDKITWCDYEKSADWGVDNQQYIVTKPGYYEFLGKIFVLHEGDVIKIQNGEIKLIKGESK